MNREVKRQLKKQESQKKQARPVPSKAGAPAKRERTKPRQFIKEVIAELGKVAWPTRQEVASYSLVVLVSVIVIASVIFAMDFVFTKAVLALFDVQI